MDRFSEHLQRDIDFFESRIDIPYIEYRTQTLFDFIFQNRPETILEVGCGEGIALRYVNPIQYVGVDTSFARLRFASALHRGQSFVQGNGICLPFSSGRFDLVFCNGTIHHLPKSQVFLFVEEMGRICKKGGWVVIIEPNVYNPSSFLLGVLRKPERGILHCKSKTFLDTFERLGMNHEIKLSYDSTFSLMSLLTHFFRKRRFVKTVWFNELWKRIDRVLCRAIPRRLWSNIIIMAKK